MKGLRQIIGAVLLGSVFSVYGATMPDVGMIGADSSVGPASAEAPAQIQPSDVHDFFVHVAMGKFYRNMQEDSGFYCLDGNDGGSACASPPNFAHGKHGFLWSLGLGVRYNKYFSLNFSYWRLQRQTSRLVGSSNLTVKTWLITALYEAKIALANKFYFVPEVGVAYVHNRTVGLNSSTSVEANRVNWRPAFGLSLLYDVNNQWAVRLSGITVSAAGNAPTLQIGYPDMILATCGVSYSF